ncbi:G-type lectin S-receptor-like serine/threonine-protein kinase CES101 [Tanacetum coccineum]
MIDVHGKLSIFSSGGMVLDLFTPTLLVKCNTSVTQLDSGNLVLHELFPNGSVKQVLWQSFDYPTNKILPGMKLGINFMSGHRWSSSSWASDQVEKYTTGQWNLQNGQTKIHYPIGDGIVLFTMKGYYWTDVSGYIDGDQKGYMTYGKMIHNQEKVKYEGIRYCAILKFEEKKIKWWGWLLIGIGSFATLVSCYIIDKKLHIRGMNFRFYNAWGQRTKEVAGVLMFMTMEPYLQWNLETLDAYDMLQDLKTLFSQQTEQELLQIVREFHACKQEEGRICKDHIF